MNDKYILDAAGDPVPEPNLYAWGRWMATGDRRVASDMINGVRISTVFLGLDHGFHSHVPILFETMIFGGKHHEWQERYATRAAALAGHKRAVHLVRETEPATEGDDMTETWDGPMPVAAIATPETDAALRREYNEYGAEAFRAGLPRTPTRVQDHGSMLAGWWFEGYDRAAAGDAV